MTRTAVLLAWRSLTDRPWRAALLLLGYGVGVGVMIALLSVGEALLAEAQDRDLVAGGDLVLLPEGVDPAVLKVNGVTGLFFTIPHAGFLVREVLRGPRFGAEIAAAAPEIHTRLLYVRAHGRVVPATASAGIPSLDRAAHVTAAVPGADDSAADRAWIDPPPAALFDQVDHFHRPTASQRSTWAEWDHFNFLDPATGTAGYLTLLAGGEGRGGVLLRLRQPGRAVEDLAIPVVIHPGDLAFTRANQRIGPARVSIENGRYHVVVTDPRVHADLWLTADAGFYLPPGETRDDTIISGYVVPVLRGSIRGEIRTARTTLALARAIAYHDHNWGTWRGVTWEWGEASSPRGAILYGALHPAQSAASGVGGRPPTLFVWAARDRERGGFVGVFPIRAIAYEGWRPGPTVAGRRVPAPREVIITAGQGNDTVRLRLRVDDALGSVVASTGLTAAQSATGMKRGGARSAQAFLQLRGMMDVRGTIDGRTFVWSGPGAAETFIPLSP